MAGTQLAEAYVAIIPSMRGVQGEIARSFGSGGALDKSAASAGKRSGGLLGKGIGASLLVGAGPLAGVALAGLGVAKLTGYVTDSISAVANWQALNAQTAAVVKSTGAAAGVTAQHVNDLAQSIEGATSTQAESIQQGANLLLTFKGIRNEAGAGNDVFDQTTKVAVDMSRALGTDVKGAAMQLGKALNDPSKGLTKLARSGVTFTDQQAAQVKALQASGDMMGAQKIILGELNSEFGGSGAAYAKTYEGQLYQLKDAVGDFGEEIATAAMPGLTAIVGTASSIVKWAGSLGLGAKAASGIGTVVSAIGPPIKAAFTSLGPLFTSIGTQLAPIGGQIIGAFKPLIPTVVALVPQLVSLAGAVSPTGLAFKALLPVLPQIAGLVATLATTLGGSLSAVLTAIVPVIVQLAGVLVGVGTQVLSAVLPVITQLVTILAGTLSSVLVAILPTITSLATILGDALGQALTLVAPLLGTLAGVLGTLVGALAPVIATVVKLAGSLITELLPVFVQLVSSVLPPVLAILKALIPAIIPLVKIIGTTLASVIKALLPVISAVFGAIVPIIKAAVQIITGVLNLVIGVLTGNWRMAFAGLKGIVAGAFNLVVGVIKGAVSIVGAAIGAVVNIVTDTFKGAVALVLTIGGDIINGLVNGIKGGFQLVVDAAKALAALLPEWVRKVLGIASPSKVMAALGAWVGKGFAKGIDGTQDQVKTAATDLVAKVTDAFTKLADQREAAQKRLVKLNRSLANTDTSKASGKARAAGLRDDIAEQAAIVRDAAKAPKGKARKALLADVKADNAMLVSLAGTRDRLAARLKTAQDDLASAVKLRDDFGDSIRATTIGLGNVVDSFKGVADARKSASDSMAGLVDKIADLGKSQADAQADADKTQASLAGVNAQIAALAGFGTDYADKISDLTDKRNDLAGDLATQLAKVAGYAQDTADVQADLAKAQADAVRASTPKILDTLRAAITNTDAFRTTLATLRSQGLDDTTYSQLVSAGVAGGGLEAAQELAAAGSGIVGQVAGLQAQLATAGANLGTDTKTVLYQAGVDIAQASVDGIKAKIVDNTAAIGLVQAALASSISTLGISTKALMAGVGKDVAAGFADGISGSQSDLDKVVAKLGKAVVKRLRKSLDSHSPSRATRAIGQDTGTGYRLGIEDTYADVERASAGLASIPQVAIADTAFTDLGVAPAPITQVFNGNMGLTADEVAEVAATKARRAVAGVNIPRVGVR